MSEDSYSRLEQEADNNASQLCMRYLDGRIELPVLLATLLEHRQAGAVKVWVPRCPNCGFNVREDSDGRCRGCAADVEGVAMLAVPEDKTP